MCSKPYHASASFHPLPPVLRSSLLQLPSFLNYSFYPSTPPKPCPQPSPATSLSSVLSSLRYAVPVSPPLVAADNACHIPAFRHPNSPYVPWDPPARREILCSSTAGSNVSIMSSSYHRSYSRSGARAPEPADPSVLDEPHAKVSKTSHTWQHLCQTMKKNAKHVAKRITSLANPFKAVASHISTSTSSTSHVRKRNVFRRTTSRPSLQNARTQASTLQSPSTASFDSCETTTLATWLAARRRVSLEGDDCDPRSMMSLEEYERTGSWINVASESHSSWGVSDCCIHPRLTTKIQGHAMPAPWRSGQSMSDLAMSPQSPQSRSFSQLPPSLRWHGEASVGLMQDAGVALALLERREREMSMPGGWTFGC